MHGMVSTEGKIFISSVSLCVLYHKGLCPGAYCLLSNVNMDVFII